MAAKVNITIKNPAPDNDQSCRWGDYHFGHSLESALTRGGISVDQHYWPNWGEGSSEDGVVIVLRGLPHYRPPSGNFGILWVLSHPSSLTKDELDSYDLIYAASETLAYLIEPITSRPVKVLRQCTDTVKFHPGNAAVDPMRRSGTVYVANTRGVRRDMAWWGSQMAGDLRIYGGGWNAYGLDKYVKRESISNDELPNLYRNARLGLNDHWIDMRHFGIINNRIFDCLACGLPVITDSFPELRRLFGDVLLYADSVEEFKTVLEYTESHYSEALEKAKEFWQRNGSLYSFDTRAGQILEDVEFYSRRRGGGYQRRASRKVIDREMLWRSIKENAIHHEHQIKSVESILAKNRNELQKCRDALAKSRTEMAALESKSSALERRIEGFEASVLWKIIRLLRYMWRFIRRIFR